MLWFVSLHALKWLFGRDQDSGNCFLTVPLPHHSHGALPRHIVQRSIRRVSMLEQVFFLDAVFFSLISCPLFPLQLSCTTFRVTDFGQGDPGSRPLISIRKRKCKTRLPQQNDSGEDISGYLPPTSRRVFHHHHHLPYIKPRNRRLTPLKRCRMVLSWCKKKERCEVTELVAAQM